MNSDSSVTTTCAACGHAASGRFCSKCGAALAPLTCAACGESLEPGARFCNNCGTAVGGVPAAPAARRGDSPVPWIVAGVAILAFAVLVAVRIVNRPAPAAVSTADARAGAPMGRTDISSMTPVERAERLFDRVMTYAERGQMDSVRFFAPMAISAYQMVATLDTDQRYDLGRVAEVAGESDVAAAQADTILRASPTNLLGLALASSVARMRNDIAAADRYDRRLLAAESAEQARNLIEYQRHRVDLAAALERARRGTRSGAGQ